MASLLYNFSNLIPAGTLKAAPVSLPMLMPPGRIEKVYWRVPPGPNGNVGFFLASKGAQIVPFSSGGANWIIANNEDDTYELPELMDSGDWQLVGYNVGNNPHTVYVRFHWDPPAVPVRLARVPVLLPAGTLSGVSTVA